MLRVVPRAEITPTGGISTVAAALATLLLVVSLIASAALPTNLTALHAATTASPELFSLHLRAVQLEGELQQVRMELQRKREEYAALQAQLAQAEAGYLRTRSMATRVLRLLQRTGPTSYLDFILRARGLGEMLNRMNLVFAVVRSSSSVLRELERARAHVSQRKEQLLQVRLALERIEAQATARQHELQQTVRARDRMAEGIDPKALQTAANLWFYELPAYMKALSQALQKVQPEDIQPEELTVSLTHSGLEIRVPDHVVGRLIKTTPGLAGSFFRVSRGVACLEDGRRQIVLEGTFALEGSTLRYQLTSIRLAGILLDPASTAKVAAEYPLQIGLGSLGQALTLRSVALEEGQILLRAEVAGW